MDLILASAILCGVAASAMAETASWYGWDHQGRLMANGRKFDCRKLTCASWRHPLGAILDVSRDSRSVRVTVTDRGPNHRLHRDIDLSLAAARRLRFERQGVASVSVRRVK